MRCDSCDKKLIKVDRRIELAELFRVARDFQFVRCLEVAKIGGQRVPGATDGVRIAWQGPEQIVRPSIVPKLKRVLIVVRPIHHYDR